MDRGCFQTGTDGCWIWDIFCVVRGLANTAREYGLRAPAVGERLGEQAIDTNLMTKFYNQAPEARDQKEKALRRIPPGQLSPGPW